MNRSLPIVAATVAFMLAACATTQRKSYAKLQAAHPRSILIVPVVNNTVDVDAPDYFLSTLPIPVAERGYYVFPVNLVGHVMENEGLSDAAMVHSADATRLCALFGADAVLFVTIERWDAKYMVITTQVTVEFSYALKDGKTGETLWVHHASMVYAPGSGGGGLIGAVVNAALTKAAPNYMPLARQANANTFAYPGPGLPAGPYLPEWQKDIAAQ